MTKDNQTALTAAEKYQIDKKFELQQRKLDEVSNIMIGSLNMSSISLMAEKFAKAGDMIPKEFQGQPEKCFVAIYKGATLGLDAFTSLQRIAVVNGRATIWGDTALALVRNSGLLAKFEEELLEQDGKFIARCIVQRKDEKEHISEFSQDDAIVAGLWGNNVWKKYPKRMLKYRARAYALRDIFADVLDGLYLKEEMEGGESFEPKDVTPKSKTAAAHIMPVHPSLVSAEQIDVFPADNLAEDAFKRVCKGIRTMTNERAVNVFFERSAAEDLTYLKTNKPDYYAELLSLKSKRLGEFK